MSQQYLCSLLVGLTPAVGAAYNVPAARARYLLERRKWDAAAELEARDPSNFPLDDFPQFEAITNWARGPSAARTDDLNAARDAVEMLETLYQRTLDNDEDYWALALMEEAADQEDSVDKHPVTPSDVLLARELYGDMLVQLDRPEGAVEAYQAALETSPNRFNSLYGAGRTAERAGKHELAKDAYAKHTELSDQADTEREEIARAKTFLAEN